MLDQIRHMMHPLYSEVAVRGMSRAELRRNIMILPSDWTKSNKMPSMLMPKVKARKPAPSPTLSEPYPTIKYAHAKGCIYSDHPDVVIKSAEEVRLMDTFAKQRLANINALLDAGLEALMDDKMRYSRECIVEFIRMKEEELEHKRRVHARFRPDYDSDSDLEEDCEAHASPLSTLTSYRKSLASGSNPGFANRHTSAETEVKSRPKLGDDVISTVEQLILTFEVDVKRPFVTEKTRLEQIIPLSAVTKAMYFKRCNGEYRNGVGDILVQNGSVYGTESAKSQHAGTARDDCAGAESEKGTGTQQGEMHALKNLSSEPQEDAVHAAEDLSSELSGTENSERSDGAETRSTGSASGSASGSADSSTTASPTTTTTPTTTASSNSKSSATTQSSALSKVVSTSVRPSENNWAPISEKNYGYALLKPSKQAASTPQRDELKRVPRSKDTAAAAISSASAVEPEPGFDSAFASASASDFHSRFPPPTTMKYTTGMLMGHEAAVRRVLAPADSLARTCWTFNTFERTAILPEDK